MKKFTFCLATFLLCLLPFTAQAEKSIYQSPRVKFQNIQDIVLEGVNLTTAKNANVDRFAVDKVEGYLETCLAEKNIPLSLNDPLVLYPSTGASTLSGKMRTAVETSKTPALAGSKEPQNTKVYPYSLAVNINDYGYNYVTRAGYWDTYTEWIDNDWQDHHGHWHHDSIPITRTRYIPPTTVKICYVDIEFSLYDTTKDKVIFNKRDTRDRETDTPDDMAKRICKEFAEDLQKLHDKGKA